MSREYLRDRFRITTDPSAIDVDAAHAFLTRSYWAEGISRETVARSIRHSLCFGVFEGGRQIGLARVISDFATYAYLGDVYVEPEYRGQGLSKWLMECVMSHPDLQGLRRWSLLTRDAHGLYRKYGFTDVGKPERYMEIAVPGVYTRKS